VVSAKPGKPRRSKKSTVSAGVPQRKKSKPSKSSTNNAITQRRNNATPILPLRVYLRAVKEYLDTLYYPYFLLGNAVAVVERTLGLPPCHIMEQIFPRDEFQSVVRDAVEGAFGKYIAKVLSKDLPRAEWLPSLTAFINSEFQKQRQASSRRKPRTRKKAV